jgi:hypothetical protein
VVAGGAHSGNFLAFVGGWFKFKLGYLNGFSTANFKIIFRTLLAYLTMTSKGEFMGSN